MALTVLLNRYKKATDKFMFYCCRIIYINRMLENGWMTKNQWLTELQLLNFLYLPTSDPLTEKENERFSHKSHLEILKCECN